MDEGERLKDENYRLKQANAALVIAMRQAIIDLRYESGYGARARETLADALVQVGGGSPLEQASYQARHADDGQATVHILGDDGVPLCKARHADYADDIVPDAEMKS